MVETGRDHLLHQERVIEEKGRVEERRVKEIAAQKATRMQSASGGSREGASDGSRVGRSTGGWGGGRERGDWGKLGVSTPNLNLPTPVSRHASVKALVANNRGI